MDNMPWYEEYKDTPEFEALWQCIKSWDIGVPEYYTGHTGCLGNHVMMVLKALSKENVEKVTIDLETKRLNDKGW